MTKKSTIAKLLAEEDIHVVHKKADTASFDVKTRELVLPIFKDEISDNLYDLFVCHEVAHALWTPLDMLEAIRHQGIDHSVMNVLEDARIEKMFMQKYPGSVKNFKEGYKELIEKDFFGINNKDLSTLNIIDKINIFYKTGLGEFTAEEQVFIDAVSQLKTPEDVISLAAKLCEYHKKTEEEKQKQQQGASGQSNEKQDGEKEESQSQSSSSNEQKGDQEKEEQSSGSGQEDKDKEEEKSSASTSPQNVEKKDETEKSTSTVGTSGAGKSENSDLQSSTDSSYQKAIDAHNNVDARDRTYVRLPKKINLDQLIWDFASIEKFLMTEYVPNHQERFAEQIEKEYQKLFNDNKKAVSYMVKEFEMKKSADLYKRASVSKTGTLDMNKLHTYQYNEDLFAKMTTMPGATNHGMIMFLDWSGSMADNMEYTLHQVFNLVWFCQRVKIPYQVLAFSDRFNYDNDYKKLCPIKLGEVCTPELKLFEFFSHKQTKKQTQFMMTQLLGFQKTWRSRRIDWSTWPTYIPRIMNLGGTPLNHTLMHAHKIGSAFQEKWKIQKLNFVFLTDGDSHTCDTYFTLKENDGEDYIGIGDSWLRQTTDWHITDPVTNVKVVWEGQSYRGQTAVLLEMLKKQMPDASITGFFVAGQGRQGRVPVRVIEQKYGLCHWKNKNEVVAIQKELREKKVAVCKQQGYDEYYILPRGAKDDDSEGELTFKENMRAAGMAREFLKHATKKTVNRQLLNKFIQKVA